MRPSEKTVAALRLANDARTGAGEEGQRWWSEEPVTKKQVVDLALRQMHAYLSRPNTKEATRIKMIQLALRLDLRDDVDDNSWRELQELVAMSKPPPHQPAGHLPEN